MKGARSADTISEFETPRLVVNAERVALDGHLIEADSKRVLRIIRFESKPRLRKRQCAVTVTEAMLMRDRVCHRRKFE